MPEEKSFGDSILWNSFRFYLVPLQMLAICVAIKNRSCILVNPEDSIPLLRHVTIEDCDNYKIQPQFQDGKVVLPLFIHFIRSLVSLKINCMLIVVDYGSTDVDMRKMMESEIGGRIPWHLEVVNGDFSRGGGLAIGARLAEEKGCDMVMFCDTDLYFTSAEVFEKAITYASVGMFYYPIVFSFASCDHSKGWWRDSGYGIVACSIRRYKQTEGWKHNVSWGWEDRCLHDSIPPSMKVRERVGGYFHQWHPLNWEFRVQEYPEKRFMFKNAVQ